MRHKLCHSPSSPSLLTSTLLRSSTLHTNTTRHLLCTYTAPSPALERDLYSTVCCMLYCRPNRKTFVSCTYICTSSQCLLWAQTKQSLVLHSDEPRHCRCRHCASGRSEVPTSMTETTCWWDAGCVFSVFALRACGLTSQCLFALLSG